MRLLTPLLILNSCSAPSGDLPRFSSVEPLKVYRSAQPSAAGYGSLAKLGFKTVVKLNTDKAEEEREWARAAGIRLVEIPLPGLLAPGEAEENAVQRALADPSLQPILVHCEQGRDRTGLAVAIYRVRVQGWKPEAAHKEWRDLGHSPLLFGMDRYFEEYTR